MFKEQQCFLTGWGDLADQSLQFRRMADQAVDEMWRNVRLPSRQNVTKLNERLNHLESLLVELKERDWAQDVGTRVLKEGVIASSEDLKSLRQSLASMEKRVVGGPELDLVREGVAQVEAKLDRLTDEVEQLREMVGQSSSKPDTPPAAPKARGRKPSKKV
jgi:hypothetical protein